MHLNYRDAGYGDLKALYGLAMAEMFEGRLPGAKYSRLDNIVLIRRASLEYYTTK